MEAFFAAGGTGEVRIGERGLVPADIAVLVRSHAQGARMRRALAAFGVGLVARHGRREVDAEPTPGNSTVVRFVLTEIDGGTRLDLRETGFENLADPQTAHAENSGGWTAELDDLVAYLQASV